MNHEQYQKINELKTLLSELKKDDTTKEIVKEVINNFHRWVLDK